MTFTITYREKTGDTKALVLDVPDKEAVWAELKRRGITALAVREGAADGRRQRGGGNPSVVRGIVAGAVVVALAIGAWWWMTAREDARPPVQEKPKKVREVKPAQPKAAPPAAKEPSDVPLAAPPPEPEEEIEDWLPADSDAEDVYGSL